MIDYRGVEKQDVINSLKAGEAFLRGLKLGPATDNMLDTWLAKDPYAKLEAAQTREDFVKAMSETGSAYVWARAGGVFHTHALADSDGTALKVYQDLSRWGAFSGAITADYQPTDNEFQRDTILTYAKYTLEHSGSLLCAATQQGIDDYIELEKQIAAERCRYYPDAERFIKQECDRLDERRQQMHEVLLNIPKDLASLAKSYDAMDLGDRYTVQDVLLATSGLASKKLDVKGPFDQYGIVIDDLPNDFRDMQKILQPILDRMNKALEPFQAIREVQYVAIGKVTEDWRSGAAFVGTKAAAQAVADALPEYVLVNYKGERIAPSASAQKTPSPKKPNSPSL